VQNNSLPGWLRKIESGSLRSSGRKTQFFISLFPLFAFVENRKLPVFTGANKGNEERADSQFP
jgi:hypothetical protein